MSLKNAIGDLLGVFKTLTVSAVAPVGSRFRELTLTGASLRTATITPGDKLQLALEGGMRTYSPYAVDRNNGQLKLLIYTHATGPGSRFATSVREGAQVRVFGPRSSLDFRDIKRSVFFGDETSIGVAKALADTDRDAIFFFQLGYPDNTTALSALNVPANNVFAPTDTSIASHIAKELSPDTTLFLTGQSRSIQTIRNSLRDSGARYKRQRAKAYWAPGKRGLD